jgi:uncharacterized membrane protein
MTASTTVSAAEGVATRSRVVSLDILRGADMVLMAIDHVRVYSGVPAGGPTAGVFLTRWVTHFCAPVFVFLAGTSAFLYLRTLKNKGALAHFLVTRGLMLVVLELTLIRASWTFNVDYSGLILAGVIWMLGWCMVLLAGLIWLPAWMVGVIGVLLVVGQSALPVIAQSTGAGTQWLWQFIYLGGEVRLGESGPTITVLYTIVPWIGVMALGLPASHPPDSRHCARRLVPPRRRGRCGALRDGTLRVHSPAAAVELAPALSRIRD